MMRPYDDDDTPWPSPKAPARRPARPPCHGPRPRPRPCPPHCRHWLRAAGVHGTARRGGRRAQQKHRVGLTPPPRAGATLSLAFQADYNRLVLGDTALGWRCVRVVCRRGEGENSRSGRRQRGEQGQPCGRSSSLASRLRFIVDLARCAPAPLCHLDGLARFRKRSFTKKRDPCGQGRGPCGGHGHEGRLGAPRRRARPPSRSAPGPAARSRAR